MLHQTFLADTARSNTRQERSYRPETPEIEERVKANNDGYKYKNEDANNGPSRAVPFGIRSTDALHDVGDDGDGKCDNRPDQQDGWEAEEHGVAVEPHRVVLCVVHVDELLVMVGEKNRMERKRKSLPKRRAEYLFGASR
jgi:hypothetical protein